MGGGKKETLQNERADIPQHNCILLKWNVQRVTELSAAARATVLHFSR